MAKNKTEAIMSTLSASDAERNGKSPEEMLEEIKSLMVKLEASELLIQQVKDALEPRGIGWARTPQAALYRVRSILGVDLDT